MKIFVKGLLLVAIPGVLQLILLGILAKTQLQTADAERSVLRSKQVISEAADVLVPVLLEANRVFGAVITNDIVEIEQPAVWQELTERLDRLQELVADNPKQVAAVERMRRNVRAFRAWTVQSRDLLLKEQEVELVARFRNVAVQKELLEFRRELAAFQNEGQRIDRASSQVLRETRMLQQLTLAGALIGSLLAAALAAYFFSRHISSRMATLTLNAERLADGALLAEKLNGNDEISRLDTVLHQTSTRLVAAEQRAGLYRSELEQRVAELATANQQLRQRTLDNDMFVYSVSHDLRSPLLNMQGFSKEISHACDALRNELALGQPVQELALQQRQRMTHILEQDMAEALHFLHTAVLRTSTIIDAMLRLSRAGRLDDQWQQVAPAPIVQRIIDAMQLTVRERGARILLLPLPSLWSDPVAVDQIFGNLLSNALNYLDPQRPGQIEIGALADDDSRLHTCYVKDNGLGMSAAQQAKAFTAFQRFHADLVQGEGIGLALVLRVVERQGGRVWCETTEGFGSTFFVALPRGPA